MKKLPIEGAIPLKSNKNLYRLSDTEEAVSEPYFAPKKDAYIFFLKKGKTAWFRKSEAEPTYSKSALMRDFGVKSKHFNGVEPFSRAYSQKLRDHYDLYCLSSFKI